jgi:polysaccharide deacetylase 2 family uncharacterized protein YibQ
MEQPPAPKPPMPRWFWVTLGLMVLAMFTSLVAAMLLPTPVTSPHVAEGVAEKNHPSPFPAHTIPSPSMVATEFPDVPETAATLPSATTVSASADTSASLAPVSPTQTGASASKTDNAASTLHWKSNSKAPLYSEVKGPKLAILIDDMGLDGPLSREAVKLPRGVSYSFFSFGPSSDELARQAFEEGHEILIHVPMEPLPHKDVKLNPGPETLEVGDTPDDILTKLNHHLNSLGDIAVGINNHMGSRFTAWPEGMRVVMQQLDKQGYLFLDSLTITPTATHAVAQGLSLPVMRRDVFLDHDDNPEVINQQLNHAVAVAQKQGFAIAIGHPLSNTLAVLESRLPTLSGVTLVPVTVGLQSKQ